MTLLHYSILFCTYPLEVMKNHHKIAIIHHALPDIDHKIPIIDPEILIIHPFFLFNTKNKCLYSLLSHYEICYNVIEVDNYDK